MIASPFDMPSFDVSPLPSPVPISRPVVEPTEASLDERLASVRAHKKKILESLSKIDREAALLKDASDAHTRFVRSLEYLRGLGEYATPRAGASLLVLEAEEGVEKAVRILNKFRASN